MDVLIEGFPASAQLVRAKMGQTLGVAHAVTIDPCGRIPFEGFRDVGSEKRLVSIQEVP